MSAARGRINSRPATGIAPFPCVLLDGDEGSGKTWEAARLMASPRVGDGFWLDVSEGSGDEYASVVFCKHCPDSVFDLDGRLVHKHDWSPQCLTGKTTAEAGASPSYEVLRYDGTYSSMLAQIEAVADYAREQKAAGEKPVVLTVDTASTIYDALKDWGTNRMIARLASKNRRPGVDQEVKNDPDLWNDVNARYRRLMTKWLTFPGIVVLTARGKEVTEFRDGAIVPGSKVWKTEGEKNLRYDVTVNVRMRRSEGPVLVKARSNYIGTRPGVDDPKPLPDHFTLDWLIFDAMRCDPAKAEGRALVEATGDGAPAAWEQEQAAERRQAEEERLAAAMPAARPAPARQQPARQQRQQPARQAAQQPPAADLPHVLAVDDPAAADVLRDEVAVLAEVMGTTPEKVTERWAAAFNTTLADAGVPALVELVTKSLRGAVMNRLAEQSDERSVALGRYVRVAAPVNMRAVLGMPAAEAAPAA